MTVNPPDPTPPDPTAPRPVPGRTAAVVADTPDPGDATAVRLRGCFGGVAAAAAIEITARLRNGGFIAYLAGGCVRDALLGRIPKDFDVATNATPDSVRSLFGRRNTLAFGASFGVIGVLTPGAKTPVEVATFRCDGTYSDGRRPDRVEFGDPRADALRRDFTVNGLFCDPLTMRVIDHVGGLADLASGVLRTIGVPADRFAEDKLRMLRAVRFATTLGFTIDAATAAAIRRHSGSIDVVSGERIGAEMRKLLVAEHAADGIALLCDTDLAAEVWPDLPDADIGKAKSLLRMRRGGVAADSLGDEFAVAAACVLSTVTDPLRSLDRLTDRWKLSRDEHRRCHAALTQSAVVLNQASIPWSTLQKTLVDRDAHTIVAFAGVLARHRNDPPALAAHQNCVDKLDMPPEVLDPPPLLTGGDLASMGLRPGPLFKTILAQVRDQQLDGGLNDPQQAIRWVDERWRR